MRIYAINDLIRVETPSGGFVKDVCKGVYRLERFGASGLRIVSLDNNVPSELISAISIYNAADPLQRVENAAGTADATVAACVSRLETFF